jgi:hypothetical protein
MCLLCRRTALHLASTEGQTATALAKAAADVQCEDNDGYGPCADFTGFALSKPAIVPTAMDIRDLKQQPAFSKGTLRSCSAQQRVARA